MELGQHFIYARRRAPEITLTPTAMSLYRYQMHGEFGGCFADGGFVDFLRAVLHGSILELVH